MRLQRQSNEIITLDQTSILGYGGEARVYAVLEDATLAAKVYHKPRDTHKLLAMLANPPENLMAGQGRCSIAWPIDLLRTVDGSDIVGFLMPRISGMHSILEFYNPKARRSNCPFFNYQYLHRTASNLAATVGALHASGYCIGDLNESNILVNDAAFVTLVDTDSFQVRNSNNGVVYRCLVGKPEFTPPELQGKSFTQLDRAIEHDLFGLAVLIFQLLMEGTHPFSGIFRSTGDPPSYPSRICAGHFCYSRSRRVPCIPALIALPFEILHPNLQQLFVDCFENGHNNPQMRPSAQAWQNALREAENALVICSVNVQHRYGNHLSNCPWCKRTLALGGRDPFPSQQAVQSTQHLKLPPKRVTLPTKTYATRTSPKTTASLLVTIPKRRKRFSSFVFGLLGLAILNCLEVLVVVGDIKSTPKTIIPLVATSNTAAPSSAITSGADSLADYVADYEVARKDFVFSPALPLNSNDANAYVRQDLVCCEPARCERDANREYLRAIAALHRNAEFSLEQGSIDDNQKSLSNICLQQYSVTNHQGFD